MNSDVMRAGEGRSVWVVGDRYTIKTGGADTGGAFAVVEAVVPPGGGPPPHRHHREDEAFYILEGEFDFHVDGRNIPSTTGAWVTLAKGSLHYFKNVGRSPGRLLILVAPAGLEKFFLEVGREATSQFPEAGTVAPGDIEKLLSVAPRYGLEMVPPEPG